MDKDKSGVSSKFELVFPSETRNHDSNFSLGEVQFVRAEE